METKQFPWKRTSRDFFRAPYGPTCQVWCPSVRKRRISFRTNAATDTTQIIVRLAFFQKFAELVDEAEEQLEKAKDVIVDAVENPGELLKHTPSPIRLRGFVYTCVFFTSLLELYSIFLSNLTII